MTSIWINQPHWGWPNLNLNQLTSFNLSQPQLESVNLSEVESTSIWINKPQWYWSDLYEVNEFKSTMNFAEYTLALSSIFLSRFTDLRETEIVFAVHLECHLASVVTVIEYLDGHADYVYEQWCEFWTEQLHPRELEYTQAEYQSAYRVLHEYHEAEKVVRLLGKSRIFLCTDTENMCTKKMDCTYCAIR